MLAHKRYLYRGAMRWNGKTLWTVVKRDCYMLMRIFLRLGIAGLFPQRLVAWGWGYRCATGEGVIPESMAKRR